MPLDGFSVPPDLAIAIWLEARKTTAQRQDAATLRRRPAPSAEILARRAAMARESLIALGLLEKLLGGDGKNWIQDDSTDGYGGYCLHGGLRRVRAIRQCGDHAGVYLHRAIAKVSRGEPIIHFNDSRLSFAEIRAAITLARKLAREVADGRAA